MGMYIGGFDNDQFDEFNDFISVSAMWQIRRPRQKFGCLSIIIMKFPDQNTGVSSSNAKPREIKTIT